MVMGIDYLTGSEASKNPGAYIESLAAAQPEMNDAAMSSLIRGQWFGPSRPVSS
jgi:hypothetical protein